MIREQIDLELSQEVFSSFEHGTLLCRQQGCTGPICNKSYRDTREYVPPTTYQYRPTITEYRDNYIEYRRKTQAGS